MSNKETPSSKFTRREFLGKTTAAVASTSILAGAAAGRAKAKPIPKSKGRILGANDRIHLGFIGCGMQFHALLQRAFEARKQTKGDFEYAAVCDVWEPRLKYAQEKNKARPAGRGFRRHYPPELARERVHQDRQDGKNSLGSDQLQPEHAHRNVGLPDSRSGK